MKTYLSHKNRIRGLQDVLETVKTEEKIAASSIHLLRKKVSNLNAYTANVEKMLAHLSLFYPKKDHPLLQKKSIEKRVLIVLGGDKGLVGDLWHEITTTALKNRKKYHAIVAVGTKDKSYLQEENIPIMKSFTQISDIIQEEEIEYITKYIFDIFEKGMFSRVDILYPQFISLSEQMPHFISFLPFQFATSPFHQSKDAASRNKDLTFYMKKNGRKQKSGKGLPIFEPSKSKIFDRLLQKYITVFLRKIIMETKLSEFSARTVAMEHASAKTGTLIRKLTFDYAKERHRATTKKQLESFVAHKALQR